MTTEHAFTLNTKVADSPKTLAQFYKTTRCHVPGYITLHTNRYVNQSISQHNAMKQQLSERFKKDCDNDWGRDSRFISSVFSSSVNSSDYIVER